LVETESKAFVIIDSISAKLVFSPSSLFLKSAMMIAKTLALSSRLCLNLKKIAFQVKNTRRDFIPFNKEREYYHRN
jgi:hypothetical protein